MSVTEFERHQIFTWYEEAMGSERAKIMMNLVPPVGWGEVATRTDLAALGTSLRGEMAVLGSELRGEMAVLRGELAELRSDLRGEMAELRVDMAALSSELRGEIGKLRNELFFAMVASNATLVGLVFAAVKLA